MSKYGAKENPHQLRDRQTFCFGGCWVAEMKHQGRDEGDPKDKREGEEVCIYTEIIAI